MGQEGEERRALRRQEGEERRALRRRRAPAQRAVVRPLLTSLVRVGVYGV